MNQVLIIAYLALASLQLGQALNCYKCNGCESTTPNRETCRTVDPLQESVACLTQKVRASRVVEPVVIKKCVFFERNKKYECQNLPNTEPFSCQVCQGDFCNAGAGLGAGHVRSIFLVGAAIFAKSLS